MTEMVTIPTWWLVAFPVAWMVGGVILEVVNAVVVRPWATRRMHAQQETEAVRLVSYWKKRALDAEGARQAVG